MSSAAKNLERIRDAIVQHNGNCPGQIIEIQMADFEVERLGWDTFLEIPIVGVDDLGSGRFRLICDADHVPTSPEEAKVADAVSDPRTLV